MGALLTNPITQKALAALFGFLLLTFIPGKDTLTINDYKVLNQNSIEYQGYFNIDGKKEPFTGIIELEDEKKVNIRKDEEIRKKHDEVIKKDEKIEKIEKPQGTVKVIIKNKDNTLIYERKGSGLDGDLTDREEQIMNKFFDEAHKFNNRTGIGGKLVGRVNDFCKWVNKRRR